MSSPMHACMLSHFSHVRLCATLWTAAHQALPTGFSRQEYWSGLPFPSPTDALIDAISWASVLSQEPQGEKIFKGFLRRCQELRKF